MRGSSGLCYNALVPTGRVLNVRVTYLIDSENVGDFWIPLLELPAEETELVVFYTRNSPHMSYESLIKLKQSDRAVSFIKCYEGTNALDFQLVSELGYRLALDDSDEFVIVTNDTGYDAAVKYWRHKKRAVKRITGKECRYIDKRTKVRAADTEEQNDEQTVIGTDVPETVLPVSDVTEETADAAEKAPAGRPAADEAPAPVEETAPAEAQAPVEEAPAEEVPQEEPEQEDAAEDGNDAEEAVTGETAEPEAAEETPAPAAAEETETAAGEPAEAQAGPAAESEELPEEEETPAEKTEADELLEIEKIVSCIGPDNLAELHNQLALLYGSRGKEIYQSLKSGALKVKAQKGETEEKFQVYLPLIFAHSEEAYPADLADFLFGNREKMKNLNSLRYALQKHYGKDKGHRFYYVVKPFVKALNQM